MTNEPKPKEFSNRKLLLLIITISIATAVIVIAFNYESITKTATVTSILTDFPIQLFDEGYDMVCLNHRTKCLVKISDNIEIKYDTNNNNGKLMYSIRAKNDTTIQLYDNVDGYQRQYTSYHFYQDLYKISNPFISDIGIFWYVEPK